MSALHAETWGLENRRTAQFFYKKVAAKRFAKVLARLGRKQSNSIYFPYLTPQGCLCVVREGASASALLLGSPRGIHLQKAAGSLREMLPGSAFPYKGRLCLLPLLCSAAGGLVTAVQDPESDCCSVPRRAEWGKELRAEPLPQRSEQRTTCALGLCRAAREDSDSTWGWLPSHLGVQQPRCAFCRVAPG